MQELTRKLQYIHNFNQVVMTLPIDKMGTFYDLLANNFKVLPTIDKTAK